MSTVSRKCQSDILELEFWWIFLLPHGSAVLISTGTKDFLPDLLFCEYHQL